MPTLYTQADDNIRRTWFLITGFLILIIALGWFFSYLFDSYSILVFAVILSVVQAFASYWYSDKIVLALSNARPIEKNDNPELYRIVENLCITAGLPLPKIYILPGTQPNAFATGRDKEHAVIAVTAGLLEKLEKSELEGVIAHELSHIGNRDMFLATVIVVLVGVVSLLSNFFLRMSRFGGRKRSERDSSGAILFLFGIIGAILAPVVATLIQLAVSRKREFLADASGALLTRYPEGLARALEKIARDTASLNVSTSISHLYFANPFKEKSWITNLFSTHPPIAERIKILRGMSGQGGPV